MGLLSYIAFLVLGLQLTIQQCLARLGILYFIPHFPDGKALLILRLPPRYPKWPTLVQPSDMWMYVFSVTSSLFIRKLIRAQRLVKLDRDQLE